MKSFSGAEIWRIMFPYYFSLINHSIYLFIYYLQVLSKYLWWHQPLENNFSLRKWNIRRIRHLSIIVQKSLKFGTTWCHSFYSPFIIGKLTICSYCQAILAVTMVLWCIGGSRGGVPGARPPPTTKGPDSFVLTYKIFEM